MSSSGVEEEDQDEVFSELLQEVEDSEDRSRSGSLTGTLVEVRSLEQFVERELNRQIVEVQNEQDWEQENAYEEREQLPVATNSDNSQPEGTLEGFDTSITNLHTYLGQVEDIEMLTYGRLQDNAIVSVPCLELEGVVMVPNMSVPLSMDGYEGQLIKNALQYHGQQHGWIAVTQSFTDNNGHHVASLIGCLAKIQQISRSPEGELKSCIAIGRHRMKICGDPSKISYLNNIDCEVLPDILPPPIPKEILQNSAFWNKKVAQIHDCYFLSKQVMQIVREIMPQVQEFRGNPIELSYWCIQNLPFSNKLRQQLLEFEISQRLRTIISRSKSGNLRICCEQCGLNLGNGTDVISMSDTGPGGIFVNPGGYVHDVITLKNIRGCMLWSRPSTENSWFPGYAWTILNCQQCLRHLGWKFTAVKQSLQPQVFYGLRHGTITLLRVHDSE